jgi:thymidine kinase
MYAGKTNRMMWEADQIIRSGKTCAAVQHSADIRYISEGDSIKTHSGTTYSCTKKFTTNSLGKIVRELLSFDAVAIDEIQFFEDAEEVCKYLTRMGVNILCAGINSNWLMESFPVVSSMVAICDKIVKLRARCKCGKKASFTAKITDRDIVQDIDIGGENKFVAVCRRCFECNFYR